MSSPDTHSIRRVRGIVAHSPRVVADFYGVDVSTVYRWLRTGLLADTTLAGVIKFDRDFAERSAHADPS